MVFTMGMMPQDAYYFFYSEHLSLSYFDHPPGVAVMLWVGTKLFGSAVWGIKLTDFVVTGIALYTMYLFARRFLSAARSRKVVYIFGSALIITDVSIVTTPDVPLILCWTLALIFMHRALSKPGIVHWLMAGLMTGLAFDCKYTALYLPFAFIAFLLLSSHFRKDLFSWKLVVFLLAFCIAIAPVILWNLEHDFASFRFQSGDRVASMLEFKIRPVYFLATVGHQLILLLPILGISMGIVFWKHLRKAWREKHVPGDEILFLLMFSLPLILGFLAISWIYWVKINWMIPLYICASVLVMRSIKGGWMKWHTVTAVVANLLLAIQFIWYPVNIQSDDTFWGWKPLSDHVAQLQKQYPDHVTFSADGYKTTAMLNYYLQSKTYAGNVIGQHALEYSITDPDLTHLRGLNMLFIDSRKMTSRFDDNYTPPDVLDTYFERTEVLSPIRIYNDQGNVLRQFDVVRCMNYQGQD